MSKGLVETISEVFKPQAPLWACEVTARHVIVAGVNSRRNQIAGKAFAESRERKSLQETQPLVRELLAQAGFKGTEIAVVVPDEASRIAFLTAEKPSKNPQEQRTFIRWKLKKTIPFDVDTAQVAFRILGPHRTGTGVDILVAISPREVIQEYEALFNAIEVQAGMVLPSTLAALNLFNPPAVDTLYLKVDADSVTTTVFQNRRIQFYRRVPGVSLYDAVYPTLLYHQDKLGGKAFEQLYVCGYDMDLRMQMDEIREKLGLEPQLVEPRSLEDIYKPALGSVHLSWQSLI